MSAKVSSALLLLTFVVAITAIAAALAAITSTFPIQPAAATTITTSPEAGLELSPQPVLRERQITISQTPINQTHILFTDSGNGTITLPNTTEAINFTGTDSVIVSIIDGTAVGKEVFTTVDGSETVNGTVFGIARFNMEEGTGRAIVILLLQTNSTGRLAPVDGMILAGHIEFYPDGSAESTMWEWQSGIPLPTTTATTATTVDETTDQQDASTTQAGNVTTEGGGEEGSAVANQPPVTTPSPSELQPPVEQSQSFAEEQLPDTSEEVLVEVEEEEDDGEDGAVWCYQRQGDETVCFNTQEQCEQALAEDDLSTTSHCERHPTPPDAVFP